MTKARSSRSAKPAGTAPARRQLTDAREMKALAHPLRIALLEALGREGPLTATQAGELLGESPANMSFHLRTLAKYGFVVEADGGTGRQRPWRRLTVGHNFELDSDDPATALAAQTLSRQMASRSSDRRDDWEATRGSYPKQWRDASFVFDTLTYLTVDELESIGTEFIAIIDRYADRVTDRSKRPDDALPVALVAHAHPLPSHPSGN